jgi:hypothetical protein
MTREELENICNQAAQNLSEHFDSVVVVATKTLPDGTARFSGSSGNQFASCMCMQLFLEELQEALTQEEEEEDDDDDDSDL